MIGCLLAGLNDYIYVFWDDKDVEDGERPGWYKCQVSKFHSATEATVTYPRNDENEVLEERLNLNEVGTDRIRNTAL